MRKTLLWSVVCVMALLCSSCNNVKENQYLGKMPELSEKYWNELVDLMQKQQKEEDYAKYKKMGKKIEALADEYNTKYQKEFQPLIGRHLPFVCDETLPYAVDSVVISEVSITQTKAIIYMRVKEAHNYTIQRAVYNGDYPDFLFFFIFENAEGKAIAAAKGALFEYKKYAKDELFVREAVFLTSNMDNSLYADFAQIEFVDPDTYTQRCKEAAEQTNQ